MFRKLISHISSSPSLIGQLGDYAKTLKHNVRLRRIGVYTTLLATIVQFAVLALSPAPHTAAHQSNLIYGGIASAEDLLQKYQKNETSLQESIHAIGIKSQDLQSLTKADNFTQTAPYTYRIAREPFPSRHISHRILSYGQNHQLFLSPIDTNLPPEPALLGNSSQLGRFAILFHSGDIVVEKTPKEATLLLPQGVSFTVDAVNNTTSNNAIAQANHHLTYTIVVKNTTNRPITFSPIIHLHDLIPYADIINTDQGTIDDKKTTITWPNSTLAPQQSIQHFFTARVKPRISASPHNPSNPYIHNCTISPHSAQRTVHLQCPPQKELELLLSHLPHITKPVIITSLLATLVIVILFYLREKQYKEELRLVRHNINKGTLL